jgi:hypothetical protein
MYFVPNDFFILITNTIFAILFCCWYIILTTLLFALLTKIKIIHYILLFGNKKFRTLMFHWYVYAFHKKKNNKIILYAEFFREKIEYTQRAEKILNNLCQ